VAAGITADVALSSAGEMRSTPREERMTARSMTFLQLPDVAGPVVAHEGAHGVSGNSLK